MNPRQHQTLCWFALAYFLALLPAVLGAEEIAAPRDKSIYHLWRPTPSELLRELATDRPDQTESPFTVDAGHFQLEMDLLNATFDDRTGIRTREYLLAPVNLKVGVLNNVDLQVLLDSYVHSRIETRRTQRTEKASGLGDLVTRVKINFWGNDGGPTALGLMPFVKWPLPESSLRNGRTEGGVIFPLAMELPAGWGMGAQTEVDCVRDDANRAYVAQFVNSITFGHDIVGALAGYLEFFSSVNTEEAANWIGTADVGFTYQLGKNVQLDCGCNFGLTSAADDFNFFSGLSLRF